jgi:hypothetical protein
MCELKPILHHIAICVALSGLIAAFTAGKWLAIAFWISAAMTFNGWLAVYEDALPGGVRQPGWQKFSTAF